MTLDLKAWSDGLALIISKARFGPGVDMGGKHNPRPSEYKAAEQFVADFYAAISPAREGLLREALERARGYVAEDGEFVLDPMGAYVEWHAIEFATTALSTSPDPAREGRAARIEKFRVREGDPAARLPLRHVDGTWRE